MRGLREPEAEALGAQQERVQEPAREPHVVVDEQQPVVAVGGMGGERGVEVPPLALAGRQRRGEVLLDVVVRAGELRRRRGRRGARVGLARDAEHEDSPARRLAGGAPQRVPPRARSTARSVAERADRGGGSARACRSARRRSPASGGDRDAAGRVERLGDAAGGERGEHDPVAAAVAGDVPHAARERAELGGRRRRGALEGVVAARGAAAMEGGARSAPDPRVGPGAAVVDARRGHVADPPARRAQPPLPVLLVARAAQRGVEAADPLQRAAPDRQVRPPGELGLARPRARGRARSAGAALARTRAGDRPPAAVGSVRRTPRGPGSRRAAASSASSQPGHASTSSSRKHRSSPEAASSAELRATLIPRGSPWAR